MTTTPITNVTTWPIPAGATADDWPSITRDGVFVRGVTWSNHDTEKVGFSVCGEQFASDGHFTGSVMLFGATTWN